MKKKKTYIKKNIEKKKPISREAFLITERYNANEGVIYCFVFIFTRTVTNYIYQGLKRVLWLTN